MSIPTVNKVVGGVFIAGGFAAALVGNARRSESNKAEGTGELHLSRNRDNASKWLLLSALGAAAAGTALLHGGAPRAQNMFLRQAGTGAMGVGAYGVLGAGFGKDEAIEADQRDAELAQLRAGIGGGAPAPESAARTTPAAPPAAAPIDMATAFRRTLGGLPATGTDPRISTSTDAYGNRVDSYGEMGVDANAARVTYLG